MTKERVVITGAAGFIGSHLAEALLDRGYAVVGIDNLLTGDIANIAHLLQSRLRVHQARRHQLHLHRRAGALRAALGEPGEPDRLPRAADSDVEGRRAWGRTRRLGLAKDKGATFVLASTSEVYGDPLEHPQKETYWGNVNPIGPRGVYDEAKRFAEAMTVAYHRYHGLDTKIVRIFNTYGPRMRIRDGRAVPAFISQALRNEDVTVFGDGRQTRSFCYISDLVDGIIRLMLSGHERSGEHRQSGRDDHRGDRARHHRDDRGEEPDRLQAAARGRSQGAPTRHHAGAHAARMGAEGRPANGAAPARSSISRRRCKAPEFHLNRFRTTNLKVARARKTLRRGLSACGGCWCITVPVQTAKKSYENRPRYCPCGGVG